MCGKIGLIAEGNTNKKNLGLILLIVIEKKCYAIYIKN